MTIQRRELKIGVNQVLTIAKTIMGRETIETVNARDLWRWLRSKQEFSAWIKARIEDGRFIEGRDFVTIDKKIKREKINNLATNLKEFYITLDMAKHLAMLERNDKGFEAREYFLHCERELRSQRQVNWILTNPNVERVLYFDVQRQASNEINAQNVYSEPNVITGIRKAKSYNRRNCVAITERTPAEWRRLGRDHDFPRNVTRSAKEVARHTDPALASARAFADDMVRDGIPEATAFEICRTLVDPMRRIYESGWIPGSGEGRLPRLMPRRLPASA